VRAASPATAAADRVGRPIPQVACLAVAETGCGDHPTNEMAGESGSCLDGVVVGERDRDSQDGEVLRRLMVEHPGERA
jgi:hypothetical protein